MIEISKNEFEIWLRLHNGEDKIEPKRRQEGEPYFWNSCCPIACFVIDAFGDKTDLIPNVMGPEMSFNTIPIVGRIYYPSDYIPDWAQEFTEAMDNYMLNELGTGTMMMDDAWAKEPPTYTIALKALEAL